MARLTYDLYNFNENILSLKKDDFYEFVVQVARKLEASILKVQGCEKCFAPG